MKKPQDTVTIGDATKTIVEETQRTFYFPNLELIYDLVQQAGGNLESLFPVDVLFVDYLHRLYSTQSRLTVIETFESIFSVILEDGSFDEEVEEMFDDDALSSNKDCAEILYNNFVSLHQMWIKSKSKTILKKK